MFIEVSSERAGGEARKVFVNSELIGVVAPRIVSGERKGCYLYLTGQREALEVLDSYENVRDSLGRLDGWQSVGDGADQPH